MNDKPTNRLNEITLILGIPVAIFSIILAVQEISVYWSIIVASSFLVGVNLYLRFSVKSVAKSGRKTYRYPNIRESKFSIYSIIIIPALSIGTCILIFIWQPIEAFDTIRVRDVRRIVPKKTCESYGSSDRSICVAKFSPETFDGFSQSLILEMSKKTDSMQLRLIDADKYVYTARNEQRQIDSIRLINCIQTGIIVHGYRSSKEEVFYCKVHFLNYQRSDTLINNPDKIEFSYEGHIKYLSDFLLAQNESSNQEYRYALKLFLKARNLGENDQFRAIVDYYIGNMYFNLNKVDSAKIYYHLAMAKPSVVHDYARDKLAESNLTSESHLRENGFILTYVTSAGANIPRTRIESMLNDQIRSHASKYFRVKERHQDSVKFGEFVGITANSWNPKLESSFVSKWLVVRYDSLFYFELTTRYYGSSSDKYQFYSRLSKKWSISTKNHLQIDFTLMSAQNYSAGGWYVNFKRKETERIRYDYLYSPYRSKSDPFQKSNYAFVKNETERLVIIENGLRKLLDRAKISYSLKNEIEVDDITE